MIETRETAIVLVGGLGSRLGSLTADLPKPMLPVGGRPFVEYIVIQLRRSGIREIVFATGYRSERLREHFQSGDRFGVAIRYSEEDAPLGTGGAIRLAAEMVKADRFLVLNGDSFLDADPRSVLDTVRDGIMVSMALTNIAGSSRYGSVEQASDGTIIRFAPHGKSAGLSAINAGIYGARRELIDLIPKDGPCSLEHDVLPGLAGHGLLGLNLSGFFIDIGVPETYRELGADPSPLLKALDVDVVT